METRNINQHPFYLMFYPFHQHTLTLLITVQMTLTLDQLLSYLFLLLLSISQIIIPFLIIFSKHVKYYNMNILINVVFAVNFLVQSVRICRNRHIKHKLKYVFKVQLNYFPNYVMGGLVLYTYVSAMSLTTQDSTLIFLECLRFVFQVLIYTFITKEFIDTKTYVVSILTLILWICSLAQSVVISILDPTPTPTDLIRQKLSLISLGFNTGIVRSIMEYIKNTYQVYWEKSRQEKRLQKIRDSVMDMSTFKVREEEIKQPDRKGAYQIELSPQGMGSPHRTVPDE